ncbi:MAG: hypothetical protein HFG28_09580 [Eubacterium sp.]|nr:hypothetical protein [Eubacterium sp.]
MDTDIKNTLSIIAFLDILGGKQLIEQVPDKSLNLVHKSYSEAIKKYTNMANPKFVLPNINIFSDNITVSFRIDDNFDNCFECVISVILFCATLTIQFLENGLLIRGGITIGYCFSDNLMVWGKALVRAYEIESTIAIYPRIIIDPFADNLFDFLAKSKYKNIICKDFDGLYFIDIFYLRHPSTLSVLKLLIDENTKRINNLDDKNLKERQKLKWLQNYYYEKYNYIKNSPE